MASNYFPMLKRKIWILIGLMGIIHLSNAQTTTVSLLETKEKGPWSCVYYFLNNNEELANIEPKDWAGHCVDESDWIYGWGPLSNSYDSFRVSIWASEVQPLLLRRHFTLTAEDMAALAQSTVTLTCSYDENPHFYLNGKSLWSLTGWNDNDYVSRTFTPRHKALLHEGDNILAVSLTQGAGGGHIDFGLTLTRPETIDAMESLLQDDKKSESVYNLCGMEVSHPTTPGVYIKEGKPLILNRP